MAKGDADQQFQIAKEQLLLEVSAIALKGAEKILNREIDNQSNDDIIKELVGEI